QHARQLLEQAARELLLLQSSDWNFVIHTQGAVDYGHQRIAIHHQRFDRLCHAVDDLLAGRDLGPLQELHETEARAHDDCFPGPLLDAWQ
ncbi:MAG: DUF1957 domain-containing protein, partial [Myxococcota bacterium]|nr:DUF1957 domain-containing protein [Myxococcota bacterium]